MIAPDTERQLRRALVDLINARSEVRTAETDAVRRRAETRFAWCRTRVLALAGNNPAHADLVRSLTTGKRDGILHETRTSTAVDTRTESRALASAAIGCADEAVRGTPGTHVVRCVDPDHNGHVRFIERPKAKATGDAKRAAIAILNDRLGMRK